jgi:probable F420-dependent oxidoreductase
MKFGFSLAGLSPRHFTTVARHAEAAGFESVWLPDHLVFPAELPPTYLYSEDGNAPIDATVPLYDPWVLLGAIAAVTETIRLGTNVYVLPLRHPIVTARAVLTVDRISRGRITLGAGVGWLKEEFEIVGDSAANRGKRTDEIIPLLRRLWTEEVISHQGEYYDFPPLRFEPKPFQKPAIPIEIGGTSPAALRRAGRLGDGWIEIGAKDEESFLAMRDVVLTAREQAGRGDERFIISASLGSGIEAVKRAGELGIDRFMINPPAPIGQRMTAEMFTEAIDRFADEVMSKL